MSRKMSTIKQEEWLSTPFENTQLTPDDRAFVLCLKMKLDTHAGDVSIANFNLTRYNVKERVAIKQKILSIVNGETLSHNLFAEKKGRQAILINGISTLALTCSLGETLEPMRDKIVSLINLNSTSKELD